MAQTAADKKRIAEYNKIKKEVEKGYESWAKSTSKKKASKKKTSKKKGK